jgi:hypothetical protein
MTEILPPNHLSLAEHVDRIRSAMQSARDAIIDVAEAIRNCRLQMGEEVLQTEVAAQLGMSASTLNKWISIGNSQFILSHRQEVPPTFTGLYFLTQLEKKYEEFYATRAHEQLQNLIETGKLNVSSQQADVQELLNEIKAKLVKRQKSKREGAILELVGREISNGQGEQDVFQLVEDGKTFRSFLIDLTGERLREWSEPGFFEADIKSECPLKELRAPSLTGTVTCLMRVPVNRLDVGIKVLTAFGFSFRDVFTPDQEGKGLSLLDKQIVVLRGERGIASAVNNRKISSANVDILAEYIERNFEGPSLLAFAQTTRDGWAWIS